MSEDLDFDALALFKPRASATAKGRAQKEAVLISYSDRRRNRATGRTAQLNVKCTEEFKSLVHQLADSAGMFIIEYLEAAVKLKAKADNRETQS